MFWVERGTKEAKNKHLKIATVCPLKTEISLISRNSYSRNSCELLAKCLKCIGQVLREAVSRKALMRELRNSVCKILEEMKISFLIFATRMWDSLLTTYSKKGLWRSFSTKYIWLFGKTFKTQVIHKNTFKNK